ncbi:lipopolysaccharide biosynthesis protein [Pseudoalteromonas sp. MB41]|uniref:DapH/DapD/GlmU-related protein n=1 Tax=Pseudoalteromonas sp. MB41 TaxID=2896366 RepID=UPI001E3F0265|nr:DapH/DapD/GlmU-related protein [Pseudoalteromonas sp. MB41]MCC9661799.1 lipopolysaccharide biosynthesis protein [Pseudoalteromonas sp. MB41]
MKGYQLSDLIKTFISFVYTKVFFSNARLIRLPIVIRNKKNINFGSGFTTGKYCRIDAFPGGNRSKTLIKFGENCQINDFVHIASVDKVVFGDNVLIASRVFITDHNHGQYSGDNQSDPDSKVVERPLSHSPVELRDNCWIGEGVSIMPGVTIGENSVVAANSVVTKSVEPNTIVAGAPAKVIKIYDFNAKEWKSLGE